MKNRILLISNYEQNVGGISVQVELLYHHLQQEGIDVSIFSTKGSLLKRCFLFFKLMLKGRGYDLFHIHCCSYWGGFLPALYGVTVGRWLHKGILITYHGGDAAKFLNRYPKFVSRWLRKADTVVVLSDFLKAVFDEYNIPTVVIPNILPMDDIVRSVPELIYPHYVSIRLLRPEYNVLCTIKAFKEVRTKYNDATLTILGDGVERQSLERYVSEHTIEGINFVGQVSNDEVMAYMQAASVFVSSSHVDNLPVSILEAFSKGLLVIAARVGGVPYVVEDGVSGLLFEDDNVEQLKQFMIQVVDNQQESRSMIEHGYNALTPYLWRSVRKELLPLYGYETN